MLRRTPGEAAEQGPSGPVRIVAFRGAAVRGLGTAVVPRLGLDRPPAGLAVTDRPSRQVGYVTTSELVRTAAVRAVIRVLRDALLPDGVSPAARSGGARPCTRQRPGGRRDLE